jgi:hypothetical protein
LISGAVFDGHLGPDVAIYAGLHYAKDLVLEALEGRGCTDNLTILVVHRPAS